MRRTKNRMWYILIALLAFCAVATHRMPKMRQQSIVRGAQIIEAEDSFRVTLLYHDVQPASDAADAKEQLGKAEGEGASLSLAYASAEEKLPGRAVYKLCDVMVFSGEESLSGMEQVLQVVTKEKKGWLAAKMLYTQQDLLEGENTDVSQVYGQLRRASEKAPRLYQAMQPLLLLPRVIGADTLLDGAAVVAAEQPPTQLAKEPAQLLYCVQKGYGKIRLEVGKRRLTLRVLVSCRPQENGVAQDVYLFREDAAADISDAQLLEHVQDLWQQVAELNQNSIETGWGNGVFLFVEQGRTADFSGTQYENPVRFVLM